MNNRIRGSITAILIIMVTLTMATLTAGCTAKQTAVHTRYEGFYQIILKLYEMDVALNGEIRYIAVDLSGVMETDREPLTDLLTPWAESQGCELLLDTYDGLVASGHIDPSPEGGFTDGILISFDNAAFHVDGNYLTAQATKYRGPLGAVFVDFTARYSDGEWTVEEPESIIMASIQGGEIF